MGPVDVGRWELHDRKPCPVRQTAWHAREPLESSRRADRGCAACAAFVACASQRPQNPSRRALPDRPRSARFAVVGGFRTICGAWVSASMRPAPRTGALRQRGTRPARSPPCVWASGYRGVAPPTRRRPERFVEIAPRCGHVGRARSSSPRPGTSRPMGHVDMDMF